MSKRIAVAAILTLSSSLAFAGGATTTQGGAGKPDDWNEMDANSDGVVTKTEVKALAPTVEFAAIDTDGNDRLSKKEYEAGKEDIPLGSTKDKMK